MNNTKMNKVNPREWIGRHWLTGECVGISTTEEGKVHTVRTIRDLQTDVWIAPGLIDLQVNGIHRVDFNDPNLSVEQITQSVRYLHSIGVVQFCPTVVTNEPGIMNRCIRNIAEACESDPIVEKSVIGVHVEGPFISDVDGPRGAHSKPYVRDPEWEHFVQWEEASGGRIVKVTLAPERTGSMEFIRRLRKHGIVVAIGHTNAEESVIHEAVEAGATMSTHLGNGAHPLIRRHPNYIWAQLANDCLWAGLIADGHHLPPSTLKVMIRTKQKKAILVSDANHFEGYAPGKYLKRNQQEVILRTDGRLHMVEAPDILSGAALGLHKGVENVVKFGICSIGEAIQMATLHPAQLMGMVGEQVELLNPGTDVHLIRFRMNSDYSIHLMETVFAGRTVYTAVGEL